MDLINEDTAEICDQYGITDRALVRRILKETVDPNYLARVPYPSFLFYVPSLKLALKPLGPGEAVTLFTDTEYEVLKQNEHAILSFFSPTAPLLKKNQLSEVMESFRHFLLDEEAKLLSNGYPSNRFNSSSWIDIYCSNLYSLGVAGEIAKLKSEVFKKLNNRSQESERIEFDNVEDMIEFYSQPPPEVPIEHIPIEFDDPESAGQFRKKVFNLKSDVLLYLIEFLEGNSYPGNDFTERLSGIFGKHLDWEDIISLVNAELKQQRSGIACVELPGGILSVLALAAHVGTESKVGYFHELSSILNTIREKTTEGKDITYYHAISVLGREKVDNLIRHLGDMSRAYLKLQDDILDRVWECIQDTASRTVEFPIVEKLPGKAVDEYKRIIKQYAASAASQLRVGIAPVSNAVTPHTFKKDGDTWVVSYGSRLTRIRDLGGMSFIHYLLRHPDDEFTAIQLYANAGKPKKDSARDELIDLAMRLGLVTSKMEAQGLADPRALKEFNMLLEQKRAELGQTTDPEKYVEISDEIKRYAQFTKSLTGLLGKVTSFKKADEKARKNISNQVVKARRTIVKEIPALAHHFSTHLKIGSHACTYSNPDNIHWDL